MPETRRAIRVVRFLLPVLAVSGVVAALALSLHAFGLTLTFLGEQATPQERATAERFWIAAASVATGVPLVGLVLARLVRRRASTVAFVVLLLLGLGLAAMVGWSYHVAHRHDPQPRPTATVCQEHSGGDTRCPGG